MFTPSDIFMKKCIKSLILYLKSEQGIDLNESSFTLVKGNEENYYRVSVEINNHILEIFVYTDGAEFGVDNKNWLRCEYQDFDAEEELIKYFINELDKEIKNLKKNGFSIKKSIKKIIIYSIFLVILTLVMFIWQIWFFVILVIIFGIILNKIYKLNKH